MRLNLLSGRNPDFAISHFLSGRNPGFRTNQVVIWSHPGFELNLGHTNIRPTPGFLVTVHVNFYLVGIQASQCLTSYLVEIQASEQIKWLSGRIRPSLWMLGFTSIRSNPGFIVTGWVNCYLVVIQASQCSLRLSGRNPGFTMYHTTIWSKSRLRSTLGCYLVVIVFTTSSTVIWS